MPRYIALLRGINVGGARTLTMDVLRQAFESLGFSAVTSFIASGNIVFETAARSASLLEKRIEKGLIEALGVDVVPFVRTPTELALIAAFRAFPKSSVKARDELGIVFLSAAPDAKVIQTVRALQTGTDELRVRGREIYWLRHRGPDGSVYSTVPLDKALDQPFTIRSIRTIQKLAAKYGTGV